MRELISSQLLICFHRDLEIPLPLKQWVVYLAVLLPLFFNFAVVYDIYSSIMILIAPADHPGVTVNVTVAGLNSSYKRPAAAGMGDTTVTSADGSTVSTTTVTSTLASAVIQSLNASTVAGFNASSPGNPSLSPAATT